MHNIFMYKFLTTLYSTLFKMFLLINNQFTREDFVMLSLENVSMWIVKNVSMWKILISNCFVVGCFDVFYLVFFAIISVLMNSVYLNMLLWKTCIEL